MPSEQINRLVNRLPVSLIISANSPNNMYKLSKLSNGTYCHIVRMVQDFEKMGILKSTRFSRVRMVELTEKGKELRENLVRIMEKLR